MAHLVPTLDLTARSNTTTDATARDLDTPNWTEPSPNDWLYEAFVVYDAADEALKERVLAITEQLTECATVSPSELVAQQLAERLTERVSERAAKRVSKRLPDHSSSERVSERVAFVVSDGCV